MDRFMCRELFLVSSLLLLGLSFSACNGKTRIKELDLLERGGQKVEAAMRYEAPPAPENSEKFDAWERYDRDGVILLDERKIYGQAAPIAFEELSKSEQGHRIAVKMSSGEIERFFKRYFPYQRLEKFPAISAYTLHNELVDDDPEQGIVPNLDPQIVRPSSDKAVKIEVNWNEARSLFELQYHNPDYVEAVREEIKPKEGERAQ